MLFLIALIIMGLAFIFSMFGLGGALVYNPLLVWFGYDFKSVVVPTALLLNSITAGSAAISYYRRGLIDFPVSLPLVITSAVAAPVGAYTTRFVSTAFLLALLTVAIFGAGARLLLGSGASEPSAIRGTARQRTLWGAGLGLGIGFISGLLGIGGGILIAPLLILMGYPTKTAAATTAFTVVFASVTAFLTHVAIGHFDWSLMVLTVIAVIIGSQLGAHVMHTRLQPRRLKQLFGLLLLGIGLRLAWGLL